MQLVYTVRLDYEDVTWSNVDVSIWNMVECHFGAVTANIVLMGPVISLFGKKLASRVRPAKSHGENLDTGSSSYVFSSGRGPQRGFERIDDDLHGVSTTIVGMRPWPNNDVHVDDNHLDDHGIRVNTDLEQNHGIRT